MSRILAVIIAGTTILAGTGLTSSCAAASPSAETAHGTDRIASDAAFNALARTEGGGRFMALPRVMFAIDRSANPPRVHWIDTKRY
ncbi:MAG: hypothetical protein ABIO86_14665, partial [Sphingomonas sp.]